MVIPEGAESGSVATSLCPGARVVRESWVARRSLALKSGRLAAPPPPLAAAAVAAAARLSAGKRAREASAGSGSSDTPLAPGNGTGVASNGEKRGARERSHSAASRARTERALSERLYLLERRDVSSSSQSGMVALKHEFAVLGSTGEPAATHHGSQHPSSILPPRLPSPPLLPHLPVPSLLSSLTPAVSSLLFTWPLHDIAIANIVWCMAYERGVGGGRILRNGRPIVLQ